jgi:MtaA/CmuA family methyltransferase
MTEMTSRQRVEATLAGEMPDRVPVVLFFQTAAQHSMLRDDVTWKELLGSPSKLCRTVRRQHFEYGADNLFLPLDFRSSGEAFGSRCEYIMKNGSGMRMPIVTEYALQDASGIDDLEVPDPSEGRGRVILDSISMLHRECGREVPIIGFLNSPADTATDILSGGYSSILPMMATEKEGLHRLLSKVNTYNIELGKAMLDAGADALTSVNGGFNDLTMGLSDYREFITPYHAKAVRALPAPYGIHQCQNATPFLEEISSTGCAAISFHETVDLAEAKRKYGGRHVLVGNVAVSTGDSVMSVGTPAQVVEAGLQAIAIAGKGGRFWLSGGCEIHHGIPEENIKALVSASRKASAGNIGHRG